jgi:hypothetical protein
MIRGLFTVVLSIFLFVPAVIAKEPKFGTYLSSPLGLLSKGRAKVEYCIDSNNALLASYARYWGTYPGYLAGIEYHRYSPSTKASKNYLLAKAGYGALYWADGKSPIFEACYFGIGIGRQWNFSHFFWDLSGGFKATITNGIRNGNELFYFPGPGSIVDLNLHFGFRF